MPENRPLILRLVWFTVLILILLCFNSCYSTIQTARNEENPSKPKPLHQIATLEVEYVGGSYHLVSAQLSEPTSKRFATTQPYGKWGIQVLSNSGRVIYSKNSWQGPMSGVRIIFHDELAYVNFVVKRDNEKVVLGHFGRDEILSAALDEI